MTQPSLFTASKAPRISEQEIDRVLAYLDRRGFVKRAIVAQALGMPVRTLRAIAEHSGGWIIGLNAGLARVDQVTTEDAERAARRLKHQSETMARRAAEIRSAMHQSQRRSA